MDYLNHNNIERSTGDIEYHPLKPFLPANTRVLFLGSFPPPRKLWCMNFFYPNWINDHWRIEGLVFFGDKNHFVEEGKKTFNLSNLVSFLEEKGIGFFDTATAVRRLKGNASDASLEIVEHTDIQQLLKRIPHCKAIVTTGEKATRALCETLGIYEVPALGKYVNINPEMVLYRLPSSSRAYPLALEKKAAYYREMFSFTGLLDA